LPRRKNALINEAAKTTGRRNLIFNDIKPV